MSEKLIQDQVKLLDRIENYVNSSKDYEERILLESYGFALALSHSVADVTVKENIERRIIRSLKEFVFEKLRLSKDIELSNLANNRQNFKAAFDNIRLQFAASKSKDVPESLQIIDGAFKKNIMGIFSYLHGMLGGPPIGSSYAIVSVGSLATSITTPYSDVEYIILVEQLNDENRVYFTNFADLFELLMISFGESPIYKAEIFLSDFKPYFKHIKNGARVDEHKKPQDINRVYGLINTPRELLEKIPTKIIHEPGNHTTSALLTTGFLDGNEKLYKEFTKMAQDVLPTVEYLACLRKLLEEDLRASIGLQAQMEIGLLKNKEMQIEVKSILVQTMHLARGLAIFLKSTKENIELKSNFFDIIDILKKDAYLTKAQYQDWCDLVKKLFALRLELQGKSQSAQARITVKDLDEKFDIPTLIKQLQEITDIVQTHISKRKDIKHDLHMTDITRQPLVVWNLSRQDHKFIGREQLLTELEAKLHPYSTEKDKKLLAVSVCAGLGGVGKTQLTLQYIHHAKHNYTLKAWFRAENIDQLKQQYIGFAKELGYRDNRPSFKRSLLYVKEWLSKHPGWLLVYDNVYSYDEIKYFLPNNGGSIILTTRQQKWPNAFEKLDIDVMTEKEAIELLQSLIQHKIVISEQEALKELVKTLGYLPLALAQAGAYIEQSSISISGLILRRAS